MPTSPHAPATEKMNQGPQRINKGHIIGLAVTCICVIFIATQVNLSDLKSALTEFKWPYLVLGVTSLAGGYSIRVIRWWVMLRAAGATVRPIACTAPFLGSIALNNVLPARLGDVMRALVFPSAIGIDKVTSAGSLLMERLIDLMTLLVCLALGLVFSAFTNTPSWVGRSAIGLTILSGTALILLFFFSGRIATWCKRMADVQNEKKRAVFSRIYMASMQLLKGLDAMSRLPVLLVLFLLSLLVWLGESGLFWALLHGFGFKADPAFAVTVMAITTLSTLVPSSPGYVGPFHIAAYTAVTMFNGTPGQAASFAVLSHLALWLPTTLAGILAILFNPDLFRLLRENPPRKL